MTRTEESAAYAGDHAQAITDQSAANDRANEQTLRRDHERRDEAKTRAGERFLQRFPRRVREPDWLPRGVPGWLEESRIRLERTPVDDPIRLAAAVARAVEEIEGHRSELSAMADQGGYGPRFDAAACRQLLADVGSIDAAMDAVRELRAAVAHA